jgi:hypothetical protein
VAAVDKDLTKIASDLQARAGLLKEAVSKQWLANIMKGIEREGVLDALTLKRPSYIEQLKRIRVYNKAGQKLQQK